MLDAPIFFVLIVTLGMDEMVILTTFKHLVLTTITLNVYVPLYYNSTHQTI